ncbi:transglycosylase associated protein [Candidatus Vecturithrix granuli]|uniref:Transglycosylase associated protein n=1 Tax=Vecturithrix granuli TaxID=1499967 RepID=A0A081BV31_VECG1|nr:transglycosylase associated protein [Candidatus Vecturithrix granuli]
MYVETPVSTYTLNENQAMRETGVSRYISIYMGEAYMEFLWFIVIGVAAGWLAGQVITDGGFHLISNTIVGMIGALLGGFLFRRLGIPAGSGILVSLIVATIGAIVLLFVVRQVRKA